MSIAWTDIVAIVAGLLALRVFFDVARGEVEDMSSALLFGMFLVGGSVFAVLLPRLV